MIAKKVVRKGDSRFKRLAHYILRTGKDEVTPEITNCGFTRADLAIKEIEATQRLNTRSYADKTFHLVVSFPNGEKPTREQLQDIEHELCKAAGLGEHQRISCFHTNTDNPHLHVAINKVHPETLRTIEVVRDHYRLDRACELLEKRHGLSKDNRIGQGESYAWLKEKKEALQIALERSGSWQAFHRELEQLGIGIKRKGAGLAFTSEDGQTASASRAAREFSKGSLEKRFGNFETPRQIENRELGESIGKQRRELREKSNEQRKAIKDDWMLSRKHKRELYQSLSHQEEAARKRIKPPSNPAELEIERIKDHYRKEREAIEQDWMLSTRQKIERQQALNRQRRAAIQAAFEHFKRDKSDGHTRSDPSPRPPRTKGPAR